MVGMAGMAGSGLKWLEMAVNGLGCWKWLAMAEYGCKWL